MSRKLFAVVAVLGTLGAFSTSEALAQRSGLEGSLQGAWGFSDAYQFGIGGRIGWHAAVSGEPGGIQTIFLGARGDVHLGSTFIEQQNVEGSILDVSIDGNVYWGAAEIGPQWDAGDFFVNPTVLVGVAAVRASGTASGIGTAVFDATETKFLLGGEVLVNIPVSSDTFVGLGARYTWIDSDLSETDSFAVLASVGTFIGTGQ